jgi:hypothetical protein
MEDDEEDEFNLNLVIDLGWNNEGIPLPRILGGPCSEKATSIERYRHEIHERMM